MDLQSLQALSSQVGNLLVADITFMVWIGTRHHYLSRDSATEAEKFGQKIRDYRAGNLKHIPQDWHKSHWREIQMFYSRYRCNLTGLLILGAIGLGLAVVQLPLLVETSKLPVATYAVGTLIFLVGGLTLYGDLFRAGKQHPEHISRLYKEDYKPMLEELGQKFTGPHIEGITIPAKPHFPTFTKWSKAVASHFKRHSTKSVEYSDVQTITEAEDMMREVKPVAEAIVSNVNITPPEPTLITLGNPAKQDGTLTGYKS